MTAPTPLKVALLATSVDFGGIERVLLNLLEHMDASVELVPLVFTRTDTDQEGFFDRLRARNVRFGRLLVNVWKPTSVVNPLVNLGQAFAFLRRERIGLIHSHGYRADVFGLPLAAALRTPIVATVHGFVDNDRKLKAYNRLDARVLRYFDRVIAVSARMKDDLTATGVPAERVAVVTNAVPLPDGQSAGREATRARLGLSAGDVVFGYVGRLSEEKGLIHLVEALDGVRACAQVRLLLVGDGPQRATLIERATALGLADRVVFAGFQTDAGPFYAAMDAFVLPSLTEGTPMALLEAMAARLPVIASAVGGVPAVVASGHDGLLVQPADPSALAAAVMSLATDPGLRCRLGSAARQTVEARYGMRAWIDQTRSVYAQAIQSHRS